LQSFSLKALGSKEIQQQLLEDLADLMSNCYSTQLVPIYLGVGQTFIDIFCVKTIISKFNIANWEYTVEHNHKYILDIFYSIKLSILESCLKNNGYLLKEKEPCVLFDGPDVEVKDPEPFNAMLTLSIYYDTEEEYLTLYALNPKRKAMEDEMSVDGHPLEVLYYREGTFLNFFDGYLIEQ
jgi:hypothetical protein